MTEHIFYTARGSCRPPHDNGAVAVVDGDTVNLTPFRTANVPPPMALFEVTVAAAVVDVAFGRQNTSFAILHRKGIDIYEWPMKNGRSIKPKLLRQVSSTGPKGNSLYVPLRISAVSENKFHFFTYDNSQKFTQFALQTQSEDVAIVESSQLLVATSSYEDDFSFEGYGQDNSGKLYQISDSSNELLPVQFTTQLPWFEIAKVDDEIVAFGLSRNGHIYANSRLLAKNCTSFVVTPSHLIYTTNNHFVKFVHLSLDVEGNTLS